MPNSASGVNVNTGNHVIVKPKPKVANSAVMAAPFNPPSPPTLTPSLNPSSSPNKAPWKPTLVALENVPGTTGKKPFYADYHGEMWWPGGWLAPRNQRLAEHFGWKKENHPRPNNGNLSSENLGKLMDRMMERHGGGRKSKNRTRRNKKAYKKSRRVRR